MALNPLSANGPNSRYCTTSQGIVRHRRKTRKYLRNAAIADLTAIAVSSRSGADAAGAIDTLAFVRRVHRLSQIAAPLYVEPELRAVTEHARQDERGRRGYGTAIVAELVDVLALYAHGTQPVRAESASLAA